ncbi:MAG: glutathione S-transferase family protein [Pseudomonadota bacterium]
MIDKEVSLITFGVSHFCEKARWALDWHDIGYQEIGWPPGPHQFLAKRCGAGKTTLPIVRQRDTTIQGSDAIIDWADTKAKDESRLLTQDGSVEIEKRADEIIGWHVRRLAYAELLPRFPDYVKPVLFQNTSRMQRLIGEIMWPVTRRLMMQAYGITPTAASESRSTLEAELDWLDEELSDGRPYLVGDKFSRADVTVASLLAPFARPPELPVYREMSITKDLEADCSRWDSRPVMRWVRNQYSSNRLPK